MNTCLVQPCESIVRFKLEHRGFTPTHAMSCKAHLSDAVNKLILDNYGGGVVWVTKWGSW